MFFLMYATLSGSLVVGMLAGFAAGLSVGQSASLPAGLSAGKLAGLFASQSDGLLIVGSLSLPTSLPVCRFIRLSTCLLATVSRWPQLSLGIFCVLQMFSVVLRGLAWSSVAFFIIIVISRVR